MKNKLFSYLGLAMRAGKLITGDESVMKVIRSKEAKLVILAEDASENARKKYSDKCNFYGIPIVQFGSRDELGNSIGKAERVVLAVVEQGLAQMMKKVLQNPAEVENVE